MSYYEYGGSCGCTDDLGFVLQKLGELLVEYDRLNDVYNNILKEITLVINDLVEQGKIKLDASYNADSKTLSFVFGVAENSQKNDILGGIINGK